MIDPNRIRGKADTFSVVLRGYSKPEVEMYLARIAVVFEVLSKLGPTPDLPASIRPANIRAREFEVEWRGLDTDQVHAYLNEVADYLEGQLSAGPLVPTLQLPPDVATLISDGEVTGVLRGAAIMAASTRRAITFCTPEGLARELAARLEDADSCIVSDVIVVPEISEAAMTAAINHLGSAGEL